MIPNGLSVFPGAPNTAIRNIASGCQAPGQGAQTTSPFTNVTSGANPQINTRTSHYNESGIDLYTLGVVYCGWMVRGSTNGIINIPDSYTLTASIEYPAGVFTPITWNGSASVVITPGSNIKSDMAGVTIPRNAHFWIRAYAVASGTGKLPISDVLTANNGELGEQAASGLADKTLGGTISGTVSTIRPSAIIARVPSSIQSWCALGDSIILGNPADYATFSNTMTYDSHNMAGLGRSFSGIVPTISIAAGGNSANAQQSAMSGPLALFKLAGITDVMVEYGVNDLNSGVSLANIKLALQSIWAQLASNGQRVHQSTITPGCTSTRDFIDTTSQTFATGGGAFTGGASSLRAQLSSWIRTFPSPLYNFIELAWALDPTDSGYWPSGVANTLPIDSLTAAGVPTTTSIPSNSTRATSYYNSGAAYVNFTSGVNSGLYRSCTAYNATNGTFTVSAFPSAPAAGDTFQAFPFGCQATDDGFHPTRIPALVGPQGIVGGEAILLPVIQSYVKALNPTQGTGGAGTIFGGDTPLTVPGCQLWLQSDDLTTIQENAATKVLTWLDKSGNGNHVNQYSSLYTSTGQNVINNRNALKNPTGTGFNLPSGLYTLPSGDHTVFIVLASLNSGDATQFALAGYTAGPSLRWGIEITSTLIGVQSRSSSNSFTTQAHTLDTSTICIGFQVSGANIQPFINGVKGTPAAAAQAVTLINMLLGGGTGFAANRLNSNVKEVLMYNSALSSSQMNQEGQYLALGAGFTWTNW